MSDNWVGWSPIVGKTSVIDYILLQDTSGAGVTGKVAADLTAYYARPGAARTSISLSNLSAITDAYSSGGVLELANTDPTIGIYRIDIPDAAFATGVDWVDLFVSCTGAITYRRQYILSNAVPGVVAGGAGGLSIVGSQMDLVNAPNATALSALANAILDEANGTETSITMRQALRTFLAALAGKADGGGTVTRHYRNQADSKNRITSTVDANGNRTSITLDLS